MATIWRNWAGNESAEPAEVSEPASSLRVCEAVEHARAHGMKVKMPGSGHSFTAIAASPGVMLRPDSLRGIVNVDRTNMTVTAMAGTTLRELNEALAAQDLSLTNMGDIDHQTIAGAISTGTHGTGGRVASLSAQVVGFTAVNGHGDEIHASPTAFREVFHVGRLGLGAVGIMTEITLAVEPLFGLAAHERPVRWDEFIASYDDLTASHDHVDTYWFPHTDRLMVKTNDRVGLDGLRPLSRFRRWREDELLANSALGGLVRLGRTMPAIVPKLNGVSARAISERRFSDIPHRVFTSPRKVRFKEMEYAVPRESGLSALRDVRDLVNDSTWPITLPVEIRTAPADDIPLSTASYRDSMYLAFHVGHRDAHESYFEAVEQVMRAYGGRPHWGKMHSLGVEELATLYPAFESFLDVRDAMDPNRLFVNPYLERILGP